MHLSISMIQSFLLMIFFDLMCGSLERRYRRMANTLYHHQPISTLQNWCRGYWLINSVSSIWEVRMPASDLMFSKAVNLDSTLQWTYLGRHRWLSFVWVVVYHHHHHHHRHHHYRHLNTTQPRRINCCCCSLEKPVILKTCGSALAPRWIQNLQ